MQPLQHLDYLEVSNGSENDSDREIEHQDVTKIFIQPPIDSNENNSDVDSSAKRIQVLIIYVEINFLLLCHLW